MPRMRDGARRRKGVAMRLDYARCTGRYCISMVTELPEAWADSSACAAGKDSMLACMQRGAGRRLAGICDGRGSTNCALRLALIWAGPWHRLTGRRSCETRLLQTYHEALLSQLHIHDCSVAHLNQNSALC